MKVLLFLAFVAIVCAQQTDFGYYCYQNTSEYRIACTSQADCNFLTTCVGGFCASTLPGASCTAASGCNGQLSTCRAGKCQLSQNVDFSGCACGTGNSPNACPINNKCVANTCRKGQQGLNETCLNREGDCASGLYCDQNSAVAICQTKLANGDTCYNSYTCQSGLCFSSLCAPLRTQGESCSQASDCVSPLGCSYNSSVGYQVCFSKLANGQSCLNGGSDYCTSGACSYAANYTCVAKLSINDSCNADSYCQSGLCIMGMCAATRLPLGAGCYGDNNCNSTFCDYNSNYYNGTCRKPYNSTIGSFCGSDAACASNLCANYTCVTPLSKAAGAPCSNNFECMDQHECANNTCIAYKSATFGKACASNQGCQLGLYCDQDNSGGGTNKTCVTANDCFFPDTCGQNQICNCTGASANKSMQCTPSPIAGYINFVASGQDPTGKYAQCFGTYMDPFQKANWPYRCEDDASELSPAEFAVCESAVVSLYCCQLCGSFDFPGAVVSSGHFDCATLKFINNTNNCSPPGPTVVNCDKFPPQPTTAPTDSPAVRLEALVYLIVAAIALLCSNKF